MPAVQLRHRLRPFEDACKSAVAEATVLFEQNKFVEGRRDGVHAPQRLVIVAAAIVDLRDVGIHFPRMPKPGPSAD